MENDKKLRIFSKKKKRANVLLQLHKCGNQYYNNNTV